MNVVLCVNPRSGAGAAEEASRDAVRVLEAGGHRCTVVPSSKSPGHAPLRSALKNAEVLIVIGGDGTVHSAADAAVESGAALYHLPYGTENLFARGFGMTRRLELLLAALRACRIKEIDTGRCNGRRFIIMAGIGTDASLIHRLSRTRRGPISHLSYLRPAFAELLRPAIAPMRVAVDGRLIVDGDAGWLLVANMAEYALRANPCPMADAGDGMLDVAFFPARSSWGALRWMVACRLRRDTARLGAVHARGNDVSVECLDASLPVQVDGDAAAFDAEAGSPLHFGITPERLRVLLPGGG